MHLQDSQVVLGALGHGRSGSPALAPIIERINSIILAASLIPLTAYTRTDDNPADEPSRAFEGQLPLKRRRANK